MPLINIAHNKKKMYFTHYTMIHGLGFYGYGYIHLIGGLTKTATSSRRQLIDAGTLANLPAGFKARGLRIRDDDNPIQPGEFRDVDASKGRGAHDGGASWYAHDLTIDGEVDLLC